MEIELSDYLADFEEKDWANLGAVVEMEAATPTKDEC